jgi:hypothetical protein
MSQRSPHPSQTSSVGRMSFSSSMHGSAGPAGMMPSPPPELPSAYGLPSVSMAPVPAMTVAPGVPADDPSLGNALAGSLIEPQGHSLRFKLVLVALILVLLALIGVFIFWAQASQIITR